MAKKEAPKKPAIEPSYTIIEPSFELWGTNSPKDYLPLLEKCTRTCYKSEEHIKEGSAEKLMTKVVNEFGHHSVIEHANAIIEVSFSKSSELLEFIITTLEFVPLFGGRFSIRSGNVLILSGNFRMWRRLLRMGPHPRKKNNVWNGLRFILGENYPFFFEALPGGSSTDVRLLDSDPKTNASHLSKEEMLKHMTLTGKFIGSRTMSHQLVRHRMAAYSQESQRYCNYGKKGFQLIVPPTFSSELPEDHNSPFTVFSQRETFIRQCRMQYEWYVIMLKAGIPPEDARAILPNATKTEVVATYTLEMWKHVIEHRGHNPKAQWEIRDLSLEAEKQINEVLGWEICG